MVPIQSLEVRALDQFLKHAIRPVATPLLNRSFALAFPPLVAPGVVETLEDWEHDLATLGQLLDVLPHRLGHRIPEQHRSRDR